MRILLAILIVGILTAAVSPTPQPVTLPEGGEKESKRLPGVDLAERVSQITGVAISPLLGVSSVGAWKYYHASENKRHLLPWFCKPVVWTIGFLLIALCFLKDTFGTVAPPFLKKPLDVAELFENKLSALVASAAFVPLIASEMGKHSQTLAAAPSFTSNAQLAVIPFPMLGLAGLDLSFLYIPLAIIAFLIIWLAFHVINVLIVLSPFGFVDAILKLIKTALLVVIVISSFISPYLGLAICLLILFIATLIAPWAFRFTLFGTVFAFDLLPFRRHGEEIFAKGIAGFTARRVGKTPARIYGRLSRSEGEQLTFTYRPWFIRRPRTVVLPGTAFALSKGLFCPILLYQKNPADRFRFLLFMLPRYRPHAATVASRLALTDVREGALTTGFRALRNWLAEAFGFGKVKYADEPKPL